MPGHTETRLIMDEVGLYQLQMAPMGVQSKSHAGTRVTRSPGTRGTGVVATSGRREPVWSCRTHHSHACGMACWVHGK
jgi:ribosomal protein S5